VLLRHTSRLQFIKIKPHFCQSHEIIFSTYTILHEFSKSKFRGLFLKTLLLIILTSSLSHSYIRIELIAEICAYVH
jgi:hypothetical protein